MQIWDHNLISLFQKAGFTRWALLFCSIIAIAIIFERSIFFLSLRLNYQKFSNKLFSFLQSNQISDAIKFTQNYCHPVAHLTKIYLQNLDNRSKNNVLSREGTFAMERVESRLRGLATITHVAPLLGLLGTVAGLVAAFHQIELSVGQVQAQNLAGGIWEALLSTVFGLIVAIPCMVAYHSFESQSDEIARRLQSIVSELDEFFNEHSQLKISKTIDQADSDNKNAAQ